MIKGFSPRARAYVDRAKKAGVAYELFEPTVVFERDEYVCHEYPGKPCACGKLADPNVAFPHPDFATLGHVIAMENGGDHFPHTTCCQRWECNQRQNHTSDRPTNAKIKRVRRKLVEPRQQLVSNAERETLLGQSKGPPRKSKMQSRGFQGSRGFNGSVRWKR